MYQSQSQKKYKKIWEKYLPLIIFIGFVLILLITSQLTQKPPVVKALNKDVFYPGDELVIYGSHFGKERKQSRISVARFSPLTTSYISWKDDEIRVLVSEELKSGLLSVETENGLSRELMLFINGTQIPKVVKGPALGGEPFIESFEPTKGAVGSEISIKGRNFGIDRLNSRVNFSWISADEEVFDQAKAAPHTPASLFDFDYLLWDDKEIRLRVPDGATSGPVFIETAQGKSSSVFFEVQEPVGKKQFHKKRTYQVHFSIDIDNIDSAPDNALYVWIPQIYSAPEQREIQLVLQEPKPDLSDQNGLMQYYFEELRPREKYSIRLRYFFYRYEIRSQINSARVPLKYDRSGQLYRTFTQSDRYIPSDHNSVIKKAREIVGREQNPYLKARLIYDYLISWLVFDNDSRSIPDIEAFFAQEKPVCNSLDYTVLYTALCRAVDVPTRPCAGFLITTESGQRKGISHYWIEFYVENFGWVPVDILLGSGVRFGSFPTQLDVREYYFGNLDSNHLTLSKGIFHVNKKSPDGKVVAFLNYPSLQTIYEESTGNLQSYRSSWADIEILGVY
ncbi:MAG: IPT/TIG domain-containing protein [Spirochaetales bacterium]|nr:IPT/TIG domain-containing protein [Spirochaetales bacterium]